MAVSSPSIAFQLTTSQGGRLSCTHNLSCDTIFQLTTSQGGRPKILYHSSSRMHFNSRPRKEVDGLRGKATGMVFSFQLTTSQGGRPRAAKHCCFCIYISTHDLTRRSTYDDLQSNKVLIDFNSRPHKEVDVDVQNWYCSRLYFNSRPHKEVDRSCFACICKDNCISTHDLTRRSTACVSPPRKASFISTHDLTRRSTLTTGHRISRKLFQLTTSQGGRRNVYDLTFEDVDISTHDLTRRSTIDHQFLFLRQKYFNSRPHKEVDFFSVNASRPCIHISTHDLTRRSTLHMKILAIRFPFQLTTSQGGRPMLSFRYQPPLAFQLTTSQGGRPGSQADNGGRVGISTHDLTRRSTKYNGSRLSSLINFNSRPHKEVDEI